MSSVKMQAKNFDEGKEPIGLKDLGGQYLVCSACNKKLVYIWVVTDQDIEFSYTSNCPYCGDAPFPKKIRGGIQFSGHYEGDHETIESQFTEVTGFDFDNKGNVVFRVKKVK